MAAIALATTACGGGSDGRTPTSAPATPSVAASATPTQPPLAPSATPGNDSGDIAIKVNKVLLAVQSNSPDQLRALSGPQVAAPDIDAIARCVPEGARLQILTRRIDVSGGSAEVALGLTLISKDGASRNIDYTLAFARSADEWLLAAAPRCPFSG